jgi:hypothetical protein
MSENRKFKLKYDELRENEPTRKQDNVIRDDADGNTFYDTPAGRTICLCWLDGNKRFFNYSYLVSGELNVASDLSVITLYFTSDTVIVKGYKLEKLFLAFLDQTANHIHEENSRYVDNANESAVTEIDIVNNKGV